MDKLRALQYFIAAAEEGSFSGAARRFEVSVPAMTKLVSALERSLGGTLLERSSRGIQLTTEGRDYLAACQGALEQIARADEGVHGALARPHGTLVIGATPQLAQYCIVPELPRFRARYPELDIDIRSVNRVSEVEVGAVDVYLLHGWPQRTQMVQRKIAVARLLTCAAPSYWAKHGIPARPQDLTQHHGLFLRNPEGTVLDLWEYEKDGVVESVPMKGWLVSDHRDVILEAALTGQGIARVADCTIRPYLESGRLVPVLNDWVMKGAPLVSVLYRPQHRRTVRVRAFVDFVVDLFRQLEARAAVHSMAAGSHQPDWYRRGYGRASASFRVRSTGRTRHEDVDR